MSFLQNLLIFADVQGSTYFPQQASTFAAENDWMDWAIYIICLAFFIPMMAFMGYAMFAYRKPKGGKADSNLTHHTGLELAWSILPCFILAWMFYRGSIGYLDMQEAPSNAREVKVTAQKWSWLFDYGKGIYNPELHVVKDKPTKLIMRSKDVLHAMYIPAFRVKRDVVPGRYSTIWFTPTIATDSEEFGEMQKKSDDPNDKNWGPDHILNQGNYFDFYCAEYCGKDHSMMQGKVVVHATQAEFDEWLIAANTRPDDKSPWEYGSFLYETRGCKGCHSADGTKGQCPTFFQSFGTDHEMTSGQMVKVDENYVRESILNPKAKIVKGYSPVMPSFQGQFTDEQIDCLIEFIKDPTGEKQ